MIYKVFLYIKIYIVLLTNTFLAGLVLYIAFGHENEGNIVEYAMQASAILTVTYGLTARRLDLDLIRRLGNERLWSILFGLSATAFYFLLYKL